MKKRLHPRHISLSKNAEVKSICQVLFDQSPLHYFHYAKLYPNGDSSILITHPEFHYFFWEKKYDQQIFSQYMPGIFFKEDYANQVLKDAKAFDCDNLLMLITAASTYLEVVGFATPNSVKGMPEFYLRHIEQLKNFIAYFKHQAKDLILQADQAMLFTENYEPQYLHHNVSCFAIKKNNLFNSSKKILSQLTSMEQLCLQHLLMGKTHKMIAQLLHRSPRTIEHHIEHLKDKLHVHYRSDLFHLFDSEK